MNEPPPTVEVAVTGNEDKDHDRPEPASDTLIAGRYRITRRIGKGGMGEVMAARDEQVGRDVAIKRMRAANPTEKSIERFLREASVQGRLEHPAIVPVHEIGRDTDGLPFFVMKKLTGTSLAKLLAEPREDFPQAAVLRAFADVCLAVELAHVRGIVHRDLKPDNIMLGDFGEVYVLDWGVAKVIGEADDAAIGTLGYMAPEQVHGLADLDGRADIYTLGCLLFEILAGEPLHPRGTNETGLDARPSVRAKRDLPPELDALCVAATQVDRTARIATARELGERVQRYLDGDRDLALRRSLARDHLERARAAFADNDDDHRRTAMREAASALALDPQLGGAAVVGRLMLEPPRETPREVETAAFAEDVRTSRLVARAGLGAVLAAIVFLPLLWWIAPARSSYLGALFGLLALDALLGVHLLRSDVPRPGLVVLANTVLVLVISRMFSPILIAPGIAASLAMAMVLTPRFSRLGSSWTIALLMIAGVLAPLVLEQAGVLSHTMSVGPSGVLFSAPALAGSEPQTIVVGMFYVIVLVAGATIAGGAMRAQTRSAHLRLQLQAWQLRQLVPA